MYQRKTLLDPNLKSYPPFSHIQAWEGLSVTQFRELFQCALAVLYQRHSYPLRLLSAAAA
jgi:hypothetical protein